MGFLLGECLLLDRLKENDNMSQAEFARRMDVTRQYVSKLLIKDRKKRAVMSLEFATNAGYVCNCRATDFYVLERKPKKNQPKK